MDKLKFGTKEVVATIVATLLYVFLEWGQRGLMEINFLSVGFYDFFKARVLVIMLVAAMFGPIVGVIVAIGSAMLVNVIFYGFISPTEVVAYIVCGLVVGCYYEKFAVLEGKFRGIRVVDFNAIQVMTNIFCSLITIPLTFFIFEDRNLVEVVRLGARSAVGSIVETAIFGSVILIIVSRIIAHYKI